MLPSQRHVLYVHRYGQPVFAHTLAERAEVCLSGIHPNTDATTESTLLARSHVYHVNSVLADVPTRYHVGPAFLERCPNLLLVSTMGAGYDTVDLVACREAGVLVVNQAGSNAEAVAEHALAMLLAVAKRIPEAHHAVKRGDAPHRDHLMGHDLHGRVLGIIGLGHSGTRLAAMARAAFAMPVLAYDPYLTDAQVQERGATRRTNLWQLLGDADAICVCCPLTAETRHMLDAEAFAHMRQGSWFVSTARGGIHDETALFHALHSGHLAGAGLDVWATEPPPADHPLLQLDNVLASPHTAGVTHEARHRIAAEAAQRILAVLDGCRPANVLNPDVWPRFEERRVALLEARAP